MKKLRKLIYGLCAALILGTVHLSVAVATNDAKATTFRIEKTEGTVKAINSAGKTVSVTDGMQMYSGDTLQTDSKSYAYISMDSSKLVKMEELSQVVFKRSGKKLEITLEEGALYFEVNEKLADDESMTIATSNISMSIRGTAGIVRKRNVHGQVHDTVWLLDGCVELTGIGAAASRGTVTIWGGECVDYVENTGEWKRDLINIMEIPGFAGVTMCENASLMNQANMSGGLDTEWIALNAGNRLTQDQSSNQQAYANIFQERMKPSPQPMPQIEPVVQVAMADAGAGQPTQDTGNTGGNGGTSGQEPTPAPTSEPTPTPTPTPTPGEEYCNVTYIDTYDNSTYLVQQVRKGEKLTLSDTHPEHDTYSFLEWRIEGDNLIEVDTTVLGIYSSYQVKFILVRPVDGEEIATAIYDIKYGDGVTPPDFSVNQFDGYEYKGWDSDAYKCVESPLVIRTVYEKIDTGATEETFTVTFVDEVDNKVIATVYNCQKGDSIQEPTSSLQTHEGYEFTGWSTEDFKNVQNDLTVYALYKKISV